MSTLRVRYITSELIPNTGFCFGSQLLAVAQVDAACAPLLHEQQHQKCRSHPVVDDTPCVGHQLVVHLGISMVASPGCSNSVHFDRSPFHGLGNVHCCQIGHCSSKAVACSHDILCAQSTHTCTLARLHTRTHACTYGRTHGVVQAVSQIGNEQTHKQACRLLNAHRVKRQNHVLHRRYAWEQGDPHTSFFVHVHRGNYNIMTKAHTTDMHAYRATSASSRLSARLHGSVGKSVT